MMQHEDARAPAHSVPQRPADAAPLGKFGAQHAWAFDVPPLAEFSNTAPGAVGIAESPQFLRALAELSNSPCDTVPMAEVPQNVISDDYWMVALEAGYKSGS